MIRLETTFASPPRRLALRRHLGAIGPMAALVALLLVGFALNRTFLSPENVSNVLTRSAIVGIVAVGATFVITAGGLDLSVGAMSALVAGLTIMATNSLAAHLGAGWVCVVAGSMVALGLGLALGALNGFVVVGMGVDAFIATLGAMGLFRSVLTWISDGGAISLDFRLRSVERPIYYGTAFGVSYPLLALVVVAVVAEVALRRLRFGRHVAAVGSNREVARFSAIPVNRVRVLTYVLQGFCVALATLIYVPRLGAATPETGTLWELEAIAAVVIGGTMLNGGFGRVWGSVVGVLILTVIDNILNLSNLVSPYLNGAFQGVIIVIAVYLQKGRPLR
jgi:ribose transport system permease protein